MTDKPLSQWNASAEGYFWAADHIWPQIRFNQGINRAPPQRANGASSLCCSGSAARIAEPNRTSQWGNLLPYCCHVQYIEVGESWPGKGSNLSGGSSIRLQGVSSCIVYPLFYVLSISIIVISADSLHCSIKLSLSQPVEFYFFPSDSLFPFHWAGRGGMCVWVQAAARCSVANWA